MAVGHLLVIAPDRDFRGSLAFMLEAEGYTVDAADGLTDHLPATLSRYDAVLLDQKAVVGKDEHAVERLQRTVPVVLLTAPPLPPFIAGADEIVEIPAVGNAVSLAVRRAMQERV